MGRNGKTSTQTGFHSHVTIPVIRIPQPDGSLLIRPGSPIVTDDMISTSEAASILGMSRNWVIDKCQSGLFRSAFKPGRRPKSQWRISRSEVMARNQSCPP
jgi:hypothetical protein